MPSETELAESLGVGKSSVREAIKMLEALGVVQICKGNGSRVRTCVHASMLNPLIFQRPSSIRTVSEPVLTMYYFFLPYSTSNTRSGSHMFIIALSPSFVNITTFLSIYAKKPPPPQLLVCKNSDF